MTAPTNAHIIGPFDDPLSSEEGLSQLGRERTLNTAIPPLDDVIRGLKSSQATLLDSDTGYASELMHILCVRSLAEFGEEVIWIDGGNVIDPYTLSALCKRLGHDKHAMLSMVNVARAFTAYQLVSLVDDGLETEAERCAPSTIIVSSISDMFMDKDMRRYESYQLLRRCADEVARVTKERDTITVVSSHTPGRVRPEPKVMSLLHGAFDRSVRIRASRNGISVRSSREGRSAYFLPVPWNQMVLDDFTGGFHGEDRTNIPRRP
ncbi:MAG: hypothetical protein JSV90_07405 [Methanobacteriota archaeon]|nr:MAG: hypothetical protein JSV90_07405 [Euryarchaeota archaeon]